MPEAYDLTKLDPNSFEHLVNMLALRVLGAGHTGFGPGSDGGRDGYFEGEAPYPSPSDRWLGHWYIQSKFHRPHLSTDPQKWLLEQVNEELKEFSKSDSKRVWPDNWIVASNIDPSGTPATGAFDRCIKAVAKVRPNLKTHFHIWGGKKILQLLAFYPEVAEYYAEFLTPGQVLAAIYNNAKDERANIDTIIRHLLVRQFTDQLHTKLEQAGSDADTRPGIHRLFIDLPFRASDDDLDGFALQFLTHTSARNHRIDHKQPDTREWQQWQRHPSRARVWFARGGPGQGKSTVGQYFCQLQRAAFILQEDGPPVTAAVRATAEEVRTSALERGFWPKSARIPITIELKEYAHWFGTQDSNQPRGILTYLAQKIAASVEQQVLVGTLKRALEVGGWFAVFDGLDEVPADVKDAVASEVRHFVDDIVVEKNCDLLTLCTSRPQGYSGQFSGMDGPTIDLVNLSAQQALDCAKPLLELGRTEPEAAKSLQILKAAIESSSVKELMTTPLQAHIMAVVIRDGGRPPDRKWLLFTNFYQVIRRREANRNLPDPRLAKLLREDEQLLKTVHNRLGFVLQARAETSKGAQTSLNRIEFEELVRNAVELMKNTDVEGIVQVLMEATTDRLVLVSTPDDGNSVRFDIRPLQEFFAAEFLYESVDANELRDRLEILSGDSHWREVVHFLMSALIENNRKTELAVAISVLEQLNEGDGDPNQRLLNRRLARGSHVAARVLQEGVLEQDKRMRQRFRTAIEPLAGSTGFGELQQLVHVNQPESREWLRSFFFDVLQEKNWTENCGAAIVLTNILEDGDARTERVSKILMDAPADYLATVFNPTPRLIFGHRRYKAKWVLEIAARLLISTRWRSFGANLIETLISILVDHNLLELNLADLSELEAYLFEQLKGGENRPAKEPPDIDCGFVELSYWSADWSTGTFVELPETKARPRGILDLVYRLLQFGSSRTLDNLQGLLDIVDPEYHLLAALPHKLAALVPIDEALDVRAQYAELRTLTKPDLEMLLATHHIGTRLVPRPLIASLMAPTSEIDQWTCLLAHSPELAPDYWTGAIGGGLFSSVRPSAFDTLQFVNPFVDKLSQFPRLLLKMGQHWGYLLEQCPARELDIRRALLTVSAESPDRGHFSSVEFYPLRLDLSAESCLLPHIVSAVCRWLDNIRTPLGEADPSEKVKAIVAEHSGLVALAKNKDNEPSIRAAAMFLYLLQKQHLGLTGIENIRLPDLYAHGIGNWFFDALATYIRLISPTHPQNASLMLGDVLLIARGDFEGRARLDWHLRQLRERSQAPVEKAGVLDLWLKGT